MLEADLIQEKLLTLESAPGQPLVIPASSALAAGVVGSTQVESEPIHETRNDPVIGVLQPPTQEACDSGPSKQDRNDGGVSSVRPLPVSPYQQPFRLRNRLVHIAALTNRLERAATKINELLRAKRMTPAMKRSSAATALLIALAFVAVKGSVPRVQTAGPVVTLDDERSGKRDESGRFLGRGSATNE